MMPKILLLTILFVLLKFGEPVLVMMSIYGDKGFLFQSDDLEADATVGFVYDDTDGAISIANCTAQNGTRFTLKDDCTFATLTVITTSTVSDLTTLNALIAQPATDFPVTGSTNIMTAQALDDPIISLTKTKISNEGTTAIVTVKSVVTAATSAVANQASSTFYCNNVDNTTSNNFFAVGTDTTTFLQLKVGTNKTYSPIMKCLAAVKPASENTEGSGLSTFIMIVTDHANLNGRFNSLAFPFLVILPDSIENTTNALTKVGYISGMNACPTTNANFTFPSGTPCNGTISITNELGSKPYLSFSYDNTKYHLLATNINTTCSFVFKFNNSNKLIGMFLIFMLTIIKSH